MATPKYSTDLTVITNGEAGTWGEFVNFASGGTPAAEADHFIEGAGCRSQSFGTKTGAIFSIAFDNGSGITFATDDVLLIWQWCYAGNGIGTFANGGYRVGIGATLTDYNMWKTGGQDFNRNPYGGWTNVAVDPAFTPVDYTNGTPGIYRWFGSALNTLVQISKGNPHAVDKMTYGRAELIIEFGDATDGYGSFKELGNYNDANDITFIADTTNASAVLTNISAADIDKLYPGAPVSGTGIPALTLIKSITSDTSVTMDANATATNTAVTITSQPYNRIGLFQKQGKPYIWKGLMSFGNAINACDFRDSNRSILIEDTPRTYASFNRIEIKNVSSRVDWTGVNFEAINASQLSLGEFEMIDNATVNKTTCIFTDMSTFIYQSNATLTGVTWRRCGQVTHGGAVMADCVFDSYEGTVDTSYLIYNVVADPDGELDGCSFTKGTAATHAIEFGLTSPLTMTLRNVGFSGYNASNAQTDSAIHIKRTSGTVTINIIGGDQPSYKTDGATVVIVLNPVQLSVTVKDEADDSAIQYAAVTISAGATGPLPYQASVTITRSGSIATVSHTAHGLATGQKIAVSGADQNEYNRIKTITKIDDNSYSYAVVGTPTTPATGTIISTAVIIDGETDVLGQINDTRSYASNQSFTGLVQQGTRIPIFKARPVSGEVDKDNGTPLNVLLTKD